MKSKTKEDKKKSSGDLKLKHKSSTTSKLKEKEIDSKLTF